MKTLNDPYNELMLTGSTKHMPASLFDEQDYFKHFIAYYMQPVYTRIRSGLQQLDQEVLDQDMLLHSIMTNYKKKLYRMVGKTIIYEFHQTFDEYDEHCNSRYYDYFAESLRDTENVERIMNRYPVLRRLINKSTEQFIAFNLHIISRFVEQYDYICRTFHLSGILSQLSTGAGDDHQQGKSVAILDIGSSKLVYKPRSLKVDLFYREWIEHVNVTCSTNLQTPLSVDCGTYGWQEYVESRPCSSFKEVARFYHEFGMQLAFIYAFQSSDFHYENVIAAGASPILIDLETLFQGSPRFNTQNQESHPTLDVSRIINKTILKSAVFDYTSFADERGMHHIGALIDVDKRKIENEAVVNIGSDRISIQRQTQEMVSHGNMPTYDGYVQYAYDYEHILVESFADTLGWLSKDTYLKTLIKKYAEAEIRIIMRPTYLYSTYLEALYHPDYLRKEEERKRVLSFIGNAYVRYDAFEAIFPSELKDMMDGDVPYFFTRLSSRQLWSATGENVPVNILHHSASDEVLERLAGINEAEIRQQVQLISMSMSVMVANQQAKPANEKSLSTNRSSKISSVPLSASIEEFIRLETQNITQQRLEVADYAQWLSVVSMPDGQHTIGPMGFGLYNGLAGMGLYYAAYAEVFDDKQAETMVADIDRSIRHMYPLNAYKDSYSAFYGSTCYMYYVNGLRHLSVYTEEERQRLYNEYMDGLAEQLPSIRQNDFMGGLAGVLKVLVNLYKSTLLPRIKQTAQQVCCELCRRVIVEKDKAYWLPDTGTGKPLAGFSHGITGIAYALSEYFAHVEQDEAVLDIIGQTLAFEDQFYCKTTGQWQDNRDNRQRCSSPMWCHGSAGIVLGRSQIADSTKGFITPNWLNESLSDLLLHGQEHQQGNSLCHGTMGNADILYTLSQSEKFVCERERIELFATNWMDTFRCSLHTTGWRNGVANDAYSPGLMLGRTGQLYALLRRYSGNLPSVLLLD
ncbi:type 2 lanthipeptide synthetase LanM family protein [Paenibacillus wulumuqiensis]|uniref:type 2 lanthipeptide synthetase LanM family protein n=1 Tax=Paenibacillus wulumuqiensis TaxID=1567107 RepID=UPI0006972E44|nr:type 2 lanthipeptide synthetase LanM family protein [Paenibacillus wulumuqiensis]